MKKIKGKGMNAVADKFDQFEWLTKGITAKSPQFGDEGHSTGVKALDYQDRLGAIATMGTQLAKSVTAIVIYDGKSETDYEFVRNHLAKIMVQNAVSDKKREPECIKMNHLAYLIARMVIDFALNPDLENVYTSQGRLYYAGISTNQMTLKAYTSTWKQYESLMVIAIEMAIKEADVAIVKYAKQTHKDAQK